MISQEEPIPHPIVEIESTSSGAEETKCRASNQSSDALSLNNTSSLIQKHSGNDEDSQEVEPYSYEPYQSSSSDELEASSEDDAGIETNW